MNASTLPENGRATSGGPCSNCAARSDLNGLPCPVGPGVTGPPPTINRLLDRLTLLPRTGAPREEEATRFVISALTREAIHSCRLDGVPVEVNHETKLAVRSRSAPPEGPIRAAWNLFHFLAEDGRRAVGRRLDSAFLAGVARQLTDGISEAEDWPGIEDVALRDLSAFLEGSETAFYVSPLVRATGVYAWLRSELLDWNAGGRLARALFLWSAQRLRIPTVATLAWSEVLTTTPKKALRALRQSVSDEHDLNYVLHHQLEILNRALERGERRVARKRLRESEMPWAGAREVQGLNVRQRALLTCACAHPDTSFTIAVHQDAHGIVYET